MGKYPIAAEFLIYCNMEMGLAGKPLKRLW